MTHKILLCLVACMLIVMSASMVPRHHSRKTLSNSQMIAQMSGGRATVDVDHPPTRLDVPSGSVISFVRYATGGSGNVTITTYNSDGQATQLLVDLPGGPLGTIDTLRANRKGTGQIVIRYSQNVPGTFSDTITINVTVR